MKKVLIAYRIPKEGIRLLEDKGYHVYYPEKESFSKEELLTLLPDCDALLSIFTLPIDKEVIVAARKLKIISNYGVGYNNIDVEEATRQGVVVTNTPKSVCESTAELAFGLLLDTMRNISKMNLGLRFDPDFSWGVMKNLGYTLYGKQLGIIGMGSIGQAIARRAVSFGMSVAYYNRSRLSEKIEQRYNATYMDFEGLLKTSDAISLNIPLTVETHHLIGAKALGLMKKTAFLINTARGAVVNESELIEALQQGVIAGAGLDVFENEPCIPKSLLEMPQVTLTPHVGSGTFQGRIEIGEEASRNIVSFFEGTPLNVVNHKK